MKALLATLTPEQTEAVRERVNALYWGDPLAHRHSRSFCGLSGTEVAKRIGAYLNRPRLSWLTLEPLLIPRDEWWAQQSKR